MTLIIINIYGVMGNCYSLVEIWVVLLVLINIRMAERQRSKVPDSREIFPLQNGSEHSGLQLKAGFYRFKSQIPLQQSQLILDH